MKTNEEILREIAEYKRMQEELASLIDGLTDEIKARMGEDETLVAGPFKVIWKTVTQNRLDTTALKKELPDIAARYTKSITTRPFKLA